MTMNLPRARTRAPRFALGLAALLELYFLASLPLPPRGALLLVFIAWMLMLAATLGASVLLRGAPRVARGLLVAASLWSAYTVANMLWGLWSQGMEAAGIAYLVAVILVFLMAVSVWFALWTLRRA